jgi:hypothetical protein
VLRALLRRHPGPLVGVRTGEASGLSVMDIDGPRHPEAKAWFAAHPARLPETRVHRTRSGGLHFIFQHAWGVRNTQSRLAVGIDTGGEGGFVIWWPAAGYSVISNAAPAPWPLWLLETLLQPAASPRPLNHDGKGLLPPAVPASILKPLERAIARGPEEPRNSILFWAACRVGEVIAVGQINTELATELLARAAAIAGLPEAGSAPHDRQRLRQKPVKLGRWMRGNGSTPPTGTNGPTAIRRKGRRAMSAVHASTAELLYRRLGRYAAQLNAVGNGGLAPASLDGSPVMKSRYVRIPVTFAKAALDRADRRIIGAPNGEQEITVNAEAFSIGTPSDLSEG